MPVRNDKLVSSVSELDSAFHISSLPQQIVPRAVLMCEPTYFDVKDCKNPFMEGQLNHVDTDLAKRQWRELKATIEKLGHTVHVIEGAPDLEDMVFTANQVLVGSDSVGARFVIVANMVHASRRREVPYFADWFESRGYRVFQIGRTADAGPYFEGHGDAIWHHDRALLWGGYGYRSQKAAYEEISRLIDAPILLLELIKEKFYHLDTAFAVLDAGSVMVYPPAFAPHSLELIKRVFANVIEITDPDAENFAGNALALGRHVLLQKGSTAACNALRAAGFTPVEVETGEFMKSGGSVFCLKTMVFD